MRFSNSCIFIFHELVPQGLRLKYVYKIYFGSDFAEIFLSFHKFQLIFQIMILGKCSLSSIHMNDTQKVRNPVAKQWYFCQFFTILSIHFPGIIPRKVLYAAKIRLVYYKRLLMFWNVISYQNSSIDGNLIKNENYSVVMIRGL